MDESRVGFALTWCGSGLRIATVCSRRSKVFSLRVPAKNSMGLACAFPAGERFKIYINPGLKGRESGAQGFGRRPMPWEEEGAVPRGLNGRESGPESNSLALSRPFRPRI
jgi:hypothetical protein